MSIRTSSQKRKTAASSPAVDKSSKKARVGTERTHKDKGKGAKNKETAFHVVRATLVLSLSPVFANDPIAGCEEMLDSMIMRYIPALQGVVLSHSNLSFLDRNAFIKADCPFLVCRVAFDATVWSPRVGMHLEGRISVCSPDHISVLVHQTFNVSIPRNHIPEDDWEFEYGPAENDPEFGPNAGDNGEKPTEETGGRWIHRLTANNIGDDQGYLEFTVIGLTAANEMLSVVGSLQPDPLAPRHSSHNTQEKVGKNDDFNEAALPSDGEDVDSELDAEDPFDALGKRPVAVPKEAPKKQTKAKRKAEDGESQKKKKPKRKHTE